MHCITCSTNIETVSTQNVAIWTCPILDSKASPMSTRTEGQCFQLPMRLRFDDSFLQRWGDWYTREEDPKRLFEFWALVLLLHLGQGGPGFQGHWDDWAPNAGTSSYCFRKSPLITCVTNTMPSLKAADNIWGEILIWIMESEIHGLKCSKLIWVQKSIWMYSELKKKRDGEGWLAKPAKRGTARNMSGG